MPEKAATVTPLQSQFYARPCADPNPTFGLGPFPSREDAADELPHLLGLKPGDRVEVGYLLPFVPLINGEHLLSTFVASAQVNPAGVTWSETLRRVAYANPRGQGRPVDDLEHALNMVLQGWLSTYHLHPNFGFVVDVTVHEMGADGLRIVETRYPAPAMEPCYPGPTGYVDNYLQARNAEFEGKWPRCEHRSPATDRRCILRFGHGGNHGFDE